MKGKWFLVLALGAGLCGCSMMHKDGNKHEEKEEGDEVKMTMDQVPAAARAALEKEAGGAKIESVDKETDKSGAVIYETDVKKNGKTWEIKVAPDGKVISNKMEADEEDEKDEKK